MTANRPANKAIHKCNESCGIVFDPLCPCWGIPARPFNAETFAGLLMTLRNPSYQPQLRAVLLELLAPDIAKAIGAALEASNEE